MSDSAVEHVGGAHGVNPRLDLVLVVVAERLHRAEQVPALGFIVIEQLDWPLNAVELLSSYTPIMPLPFPASIRTRSSSRHQALLTTPAVASTR